MNKYHVETKDGLLKIEADNVHKDRDGCLIFEDEKGELLAGFNKDEYVMFEKLKE